MVAEAAVIGTADERWQERPLVFIVPVNDALVTAGEIRAFLSDRVARFWVPEYWHFTAEIPKTSVGKIDKRALRDQHAAGEIAIEACRD